MTSYRWPLIIYATRKQFTSPIIYGLYTCSDNVFSIVCILYRPSFRLTPPIPNLCTVPPLKRNRPNYKIWRQAPLFSLQCIFIYRGSEISFMLFSRETFHKSKKNYWFIVHIEKPWVFSNLYCFDYGIIIIIIEYKFSTCEWSVQTAFQEYIADHRLQTFLRLHRVKSNIQC